MAEYRAQGKCFTCASTEHIAKDCPKRNQLKPKPGSAAATVDLAEVDRLTTLRAAQSLGVIALSIEHVQPSPEHVEFEAINDILVARMKADLRAEAGGSTIHI